MTSFRSRDLPAIVKAEAMHDVGDSRTTLMDEQRIEQNRASGDMLEYAIVGSSVAMSLVRRLSRPDAEWLTTQGGKPRGMLSPLSALEHLTLYGIPASAAAKATVRRAGLEVKV